MRTVLTVAGYDPSGGAGIQQDPTHPCHVRMKPYNRRYSVKYLADVCSIRL